MKKSILYIRCDEEFKKRIKSFKEIHGFKTLEDAIRYLLDHYERRLITSY